MSYICLYMGGRENIFDIWLIYIWYIYSEVLHFSVLRSFLTGRIMKWGQNNAECSHQNLAHRPHRTQICHRKTNLQTSFDRTLWRGEKRGLILQWWRSDPHHGFQEKKRRFWLHHLQHSRLWRRRREEFKLYHSRFQTFFKRGSGRVYRVSLFFCKTTLGAERHT